MATPIPENRARTTTRTATEAVGGALRRGQRESDRVHLGITSDSRAVKPGNVFVALRGESFDGHTFVEQALKRGATLFVVQRGQAWRIAGADVIEVEDTLVAWGDLARSHLRRWRSESGGARRVVAITGSAGKTTTKEITAALLGIAGAVHRTAGNLNNLIGVPAVAFGVESPHRFAVLEVGMSVPGEIDALAAVSEPDVAVITNIGLAHTEGVVGGRAAVAREKGDLFEGLRESGVAIVNLDDELVRSESRRSRGSRVVTFGRHADATYRLADRTPLGLRGSHVVIEGAGPNTRREVTLPLIGEAAALDLVAALAAAEAAAGTVFEARAIEAALAKLALPGGRGSLRVLRDGTILYDDTYNANPESMRAALGSLREIASAEGRRAVAVLGEMKELGGEAEAEHAAMGDALVLSKIDIAIGCGGLIDLALDRAAAGGIAVHKTTSVEAAVKLAVGLVRAGDVVLIKGSRSVGTELVADAIAEKGDRL
ncbi:MAG: UDP-N-acetylmuramoylalanyl-D-glutamyl-2,6-diaminopimelate--D-alanyl-D-alanine ligase [Myxococcaceae bacterium]|nr:UDP-N-acetylmuramoylalanyl-D-glutamyl-2,6-diaminopimelate--D-alanyl-D-alanine ligase [Myxococcaceae bacterium]